MDPQTVFENWLADDSKKGRRIQARSYRAWRKQGGFPARAMMHPATDTWMSGDKYADVIDLTDDSVIVILDRSEKTRRVNRANILTIP